MTNTAYESDSTLFALASSVAKDSNSWHGWWCLHIALPEGQEKGFWCAKKHVIPPVMFHLRDEHYQVIVDSRNNAFLVCRQTDKATMHAIGMQIIYSYPEEGPKPYDFSVYDLGVENQRFLREISERFDYILDASDGLHDAEEAYWDNLFFQGNSNLWNNFHESADCRNYRDKPYIMLVEDDPLTQRMVSKVLSDVGEVITVETAKEAIEGYVATAPEIVFMDINLTDSERNGMSIMQHLVSQDSEAFVVMFSANDTVENIIKAINAGARGFVAKPFNRLKLDYYIRLNRSERSYQRQQVLAAQTVQPQ
jgi:two-component system chemotaxis response regulator CheY